MSIQLKTTKPIRKSTRISILEVNKLSEAFDKMLASTCVTLSSKNTSTKSTCISELDTLASYSTVTSALHQKFELFSLIHTHSTEPLKTAADLAQRVVLEIINLPANESKASTESSTYDESQWVNRLEDKLNTILEGSHFIVLNPLYQEILDVVSLGKHYHFKAIYHILYKIQQKNLNPQNSEPKSGMQVNAAGGKLKKTAKATHTKNKEKQKYASTKVNGDKKPKKAKLAPKPKKKA